MSKSGDPGEGQAMQGVPHPIKWENEIEQQQQVDLEKNIRITSKGLKKTKKKTKIMVD